MTTSYTTDDLVAIETAIKSGTVSVKYADREVTYRSLKEMRGIRTDIRQALGLITKGGRQRSYFQFSKGLDR